MQPYRLFQAEEEVHVVHGLSRGTFHQIVDYGGDEQLAVDFFKVEYALVGVDHVLEVGSLVGHECEVVVGIIVLIEFSQLFDSHGAVEVYNSHYSAREATSHGDEVDVGFEAVLKLSERLAYLGEVLVLEWLVDRHVVVAP